MKATCCLYNLVLHGKNTYHYKLIVSISIANDSQPFVANSSLLLEQHPSTCATRHTDRIQGAVMPSMIAWTGGVIQRPIGSSPLLATIIQDPTWPQESLTK